MTTWDATCDRKLHRLMAYVRATLGKRTYGWVGDAARELQPQLYADADLGWCPSIQRNTTGVWHGVRGAHTCFPIACVSKRQGAVAHSTPEAELVSFDHALHVVGVPAMDLWKVLSLVHVCASGRTTPPPYVW